MFPSKHEGGRGGGMMNFNCTVELKSGKAFLLRRAPGLAISKGTQTSVCWFVERSLESPGSA